MNNFSKFIIFLVLALAIWWCYDNFLSNKINLESVSEIQKNIIKKQDNSKNNEKTENISIQTPTEEEPQEELKNESKDSYIYVYMLTTDKTGAQFLKPVKRPLAPGKDRLTQSVTMLLSGPNNIEISQGIYSEIPDSARLISVTTSDDRTTINLTGSFGNGGGSDSTYSRLRQLIKTVLANSDKPVYLQFDGKQVDVVGGEGITVSQPLSEKSLDE